MDDILSDGVSAEISMNGSSAYASRHGASTSSSGRVSGTVIVERIPRATGRRCGVNTRSASAFHAAERRAHLLEVAVRVADAVRAIVLGDLGEEVLALRRIARAGDAARGVRDDRRAGRDETALDERREREEDRRRIAPGIRDELGAA